MKRRATITLEVAEIFLLRRGGKFATAYCPLCCCDVDLASPELLATILSMTEREIFRLIEAEKVFFVEGKRLLACSTCVERSVQPNE